MFRRRAQALRRPVFDTLPGRVFLVTAAGKLGDQHDDMTMVVLKSEDEG